MNVIQELEKEMAAKNTYDDVNIGDQVQVHYRIVEGEKERVQLFKGFVIARKGSRARETITVRNVLQGIGVERKFPLCSPRLEKIVVKRKGNARRSKLYYYRDRIGRTTKVK